MDEFTKAYCIAALWAEHGLCSTEDEFLDENYDISDFSYEAMMTIIADCDKFRHENAKLMEGLDAAQCGHDFLLTRNGHGTGFWDRGYPDSIGDALTKAAESFKEMNFVVENNEVCIF